MPEVVRVALDVWFQQETLTRRQLKTLFDWFSDIYYDDPACDCADCQIDKAVN